MSIKYLLSCIALIFLSTTISAQPTITSTDIINGTFQFTVVQFNQGVYNPGNSGANITWDFSGVQGTVGTIKMRYGACPGISECTSFPTANRYAVSLDSNGIPSNDKSLFRVTSAQLELLGSRNIANNFTLAYTDTPIELKFPTVYLQSFTDTSSYTINGVTTSTNDVITADGYGTVITPAGTYTNVLRIKKESMITQSMVGIPDTKTQMVSYAWYKNNREVIAGFYVANIIAPTPGPIPSSFQYTNNQVLAVDEIPVKKSVLTVYPNPVKDGKIWIEVKESGIKMVDIFDMTGRKVLTLPGAQLKQKDGKYAVDLKDISDGNYVIKVETDKNLLSNTIQIQK